LVGSDRVRRAINSNSFIEQRVQILVLCPQH
jgi:hypothetical protein